MPTTDRGAGAVSRIHLCRCQLIWRATRLWPSILAAFGTELGGKRAMNSTWGKLAKDVAAECAQGRTREHHGTGIDAGGEGCVARSACGLRCASSRKLRT